MENIENSIGTIGTLASSNCVSVAAGGTTGSMFYYPAHNQFGYGEFAINRAQNGYIVDKAGLGKFLFITEKDLADWLIKELKAKK